MAARLAILTALKPGSCQRLCNSLVLEVNTANQHSAATLSTVMLCLIDTSSAVPHHDKVIVVAVILVKVATKTISS